MEIKYELTPQDLVEFQQIAAREDKVNITSGRILGVVSMLLLLADFIYCLMSGSIDFSARSILIHLSGRLVLLFLLLIASAGVLRLIHKKMVDKIARTDKNGTFCEHKIILNEKEFIELTDVNISRYSWTGMGEISENEKFVVIPVNLSASYIIPKVHFEDETHIKHFIETAVEYKRNAELRFNKSYFVKYELES